MESAANTFTTTSINIPTNLLQAKGSKRTIIEVLWIELAYLNDDYADGSVGQVSFTTGSAPTSILAVNDPRTFAWDYLYHSLTTSGAVQQKQPRKKDLQSNDGYGYLIAGDRFHVSIKGTSQGGALTAYWRMYYRQVAVSIEEYVGIVQSQSQQ